jgi:excisionase family DNA binding protein
LESIFDKEARVKLQQHYRLKDVAKMLSISEKSLYRWIKEKKLKAHKIGGSIRIPRSELLRFIQPFE